MTNFVATFYSQYGAVQFRRYAKSKKIGCRLAPVPRVLSSSCGTCAHYKGDSWDIGFRMKDLETVYQLKDDGSYEIVHTSDLSDS
ncbi:MAG: DUF3343 domain-containing protein [Sphaerochaetaceae bacterium]|nr:DUF3343 domain-containing protein [Sphaerochaetaceae bacterium]